MHRWQPAEQLRDKDTSHLKERIFVAHCNLTSGRLTQAFIMLIDMWGSTCTIQQIAYLGNVTRLVVVPNIAACSAVAATTLSV